MRKKKNEEPSFGAIKNQATQVVTIPPPPQKLVELHPKEPTKAKESEYNQSTSKRQLTLAKPPLSKRPKSDGLNLEKKKNIIPVKDNDLFTSRW